MALRREDGTEPAWSGLVSIPVLIALVFGGLYCFTIFEPDKTPMVADEKSVPGVGDIALCTASVLDDVNNMPPMQKLREAQAKNEPTDDAVGLARHLLNKDKWNVMNLMCVGNVFTSVADNNLNTEGFSCLQLSTQLCPQSKYVRLNYARALARAKRYEQAAAEYEKIIKLQHDIMPSLELARLYMSNGDQDKAIEVLQTVLKKDFGNSPARKLLGVAMALNHDEKGGYEEYIKAFAQEQMNGYPDAAKDLMEKNGGSLAKAVEELQTTIKANPTDVPNKILLAELLIFQKHLPESKSFLEEMEKPTDKDPQVHRVLAEVYDQMDQKEVSYQEWLTANKLEKEGT